MNKRKWLAVGLSAALAGCLGWAIAACAPAEPNVPNEAEHTHTFTGWEHNETHHWRVCPAEGEIDVSSREPHNFVDGVCECGATKELPPAMTEQIYIVGNLKYYSTKWPSGKNVSGCIKLDYDAETGEWSIVLRLGGTGAGKYGRTDEFKLFDSVSGKYFPDGVGNNKSFGTNNGGDYKVSWKKGDTDVTFTKLEHTHVFDDIKRDDTQHWTMCWLGDAEKEGTREKHDWTSEQDETCDFCGFTRHVHKYTEQAKDATQHWMVCPDDGEISPDGKTDHVYDPVTGKCSCGAMKAEDCAHDGKITFEYTEETVPEGVAGGGTLTGKCEKCGDPVEVRYDDTSLYPSIGTGGSCVPPAVVESNKTYYGKAQEDRHSSVFIGYAIEAAGTFTLTADIVYAGNAARTDYLTVMYFTVATEPLDQGVLNVPNKQVFYDHEWNHYNRATKEILAAVAKWKKQVTFDTPIGDHTNMQPFTGMTFTFQEEDVGKYLYVNLLMTDGYNDKSEAGQTFLVRTKFTPAAAANVSRIDADCGDKERFPADSCLLACDRKSEV